MDASVAIAVYEKLQRVLIPNDMCSVYETLFLFYYRFLSEEAAEEKLRSIFYTYDREYDLSTDFEFLKYTVQQDCRTLANDV